jgi:hypothetical protein
MSSEQATKTLGRKRSNSLTSHLNFANVNKRRKSGNDTDARESPSTPSPSHGRQRKRSSTFTSAGDTNWRPLVLTRTPLKIHQAVSSPARNASNTIPTERGKDPHTEPTTPNRILQTLTIRCGKENKLNEDFTATPNGNSSRSSSPYTPFEVKKTFRCHVCSKSKQPYSFYTGELEGMVNCVICGHDICAACPRYVNGILDEFVLVRPAVGLEVGNGGPKGGMENGLFE